MANPLQTGKKSVDLASSGRRVSRIRRDPPPIAKKIVVRDAEERDQRTVVIGISAFAIAIAIVMFGISINYGWQPAEYNIEL
jgi:hypothetical protein